MTNDFPGTKQPDLSKLPATDREKQIAAEYTRVSTEDSIPVFVVGHQSFQLGGLTGRGDDQANWTCWMLAKAIRKIEDAVAYSKAIEKVHEIADVFSDVYVGVGPENWAVPDVNIVRTVESVGKLQEFLGCIGVDTTKSVIAQQPVTIGVYGSVVTIQCDSPESAVEVEAYVSAVSELESWRELLAANAGLTVDGQPLEAK